MSKYRLHKEDGYIIDCGRCGSPAPTIARDWDDLGTPRDQIPTDRRKHEYLCQFCYETNFGNILKYRHYNGDVKTIAKAMCQALNLLAAKK